MKVDFLVFVRVALIFVLVAILSVLYGCGSMIQAVNAYGTVAVHDARAANDTVIAGWTVAACGTPVSAALRNPEIIPALQALCPGLANSHLFDKVQP